MLGAAQFMVDFRGMHLNTKKSLYINYQNHVSVFCMEMLSTVNGEGHVWCYVLSTSMCATKNNILAMKDRYSGLIFQHALANILNVSQRFINLLHRPTKPHTNLVSYLTDRRETKKRMIILMILFFYWKRVSVKLLQQDMSERSLAWKQEMTMARRCYSHITPQSTSTMHVGTLSVDPFSWRKSRYDHLYHIN